MRDQIQIEKVREILLESWDPFCVGDNPNLAGEYDSFIAGIIHLLDNQASSNDLEQYFVKIENELDAPVSDENRIRTIKALQSL